MTANELSHIVIGKAIEVHSRLGPGLFERIYEKALLFELRGAGLNVLEQLDLPVIYKGQDLDIGYRLDLLVEEKLIIEVKAIEAFDDIHMSQIMTYLRLTGCSLGLLMNFNVPLMKHGIQRVVLGDPDQ
ncbi:MAG: GxxExxY protein [Flavobacteriales bacterium]|nr:GxxExxY protein [Flavobacteriales bacterium]